MHPAQNSHIVKTSSRISIFFLSITSLFITACSGEIDQADIYGGSVLDKQAATLREGGKPVNGTVVAKDANQRMTSETTYKDGFPNGLMREWYPNGQLKFEKEARYVDKGQFGGGLEVIGVNKSWCENGTLRADQPGDSNGKPRGTHKNWTCDGKLLYEADMPAGKFKRWQETQDGEIFLSEEGKRVESGFLDGEHKQYAPDGSLLLIENWKNEKQHGEYKKLHHNGSIAEQGKYDQGIKKGVWIVSHGNFNYQYWDYDPENFNKQDYVGPFLQAAGIEASGNQAQYLRDYQVDTEKLKYYVTQGLVDPGKKLNLDIYTRYNEFKSKDWTYPYIRASRTALPTLLELGADPRAIDAKQRNRLHYCIDSMYQDGCNLEDVKTLIELGLNAGQADNAGHTPLHRLMFQTRVTDETSRYRQKRIATFADLKPYIELLTQGGASPDDAANDGATPIMLALQNQLFDVAAELLQSSKSPNQSDREGLNLVTRVFYNPYTRQFNLNMPAEARTFIELAVSKGVDPLQPVGDGGVNLVELAEKNGAIDLAIYLKNLKKGS